MNRSHSPQQLSLQVHLDDEATFDNFYAPAGSTNAQVVMALRSMFESWGEPFIFIWGRSGVGLTHLLQAACHNAEQSQLQVQYLPLRDLARFAPEALFEGLDELDLVCLDGLDAVAGQSDWEQALFHLFNRLRDGGKRLVVAAEQGPHQLAIQLPDLNSRLNVGLSFQVQGLADEEIQAALQMRAREMGLELTDEVAQFILYRAPRGMNELFVCLKRLDHASLAEQRKLTIPFIKQVLVF